VFNGNEKKVETARLYDGGRYWLGAGFSFIQFPRMQLAYVWSATYKKSRGFTDNDDLVTVTSSSINTRTQDGLRISLDVSIHYKAGTSFGNTTALLQEYHALYQRYGEPLTSWKQIIKQVSIASINNACSRYQAVDFFRSRDSLINAIEIEVKENLALLGFTMMRLNIMNVNIPDKFDESVKKTQIIKQKQEQYNFTKAIEDIKGETLVMSANMDQTIQIS
jgi:hypothetical protein